MGKKKQNGKRNVDRVRELERELEKKGVAIEVLKAECERLVGDGFRYGRKGGNPSALEDKQRLDAAIAEVRNMVNANMLAVCMAYGAQTENDLVIFIPTPNTALLAEWNVGAYSHDGGMMVVAQRNGEELSATDGVWVTKD